MGFAPRRLGRIRRQHWPICRRHPRPNGHSRRHCQRGRGEDNIARRCNVSQREPKTSTRLLNWALQRHRCLSSIRSDYSRALNAYHIPGFHWAPRCHVVIRKSDRYTQRTNLCECADGYSNAADKFGQVTYKVPLSAHLQKPKVVSIAFVALFFAAFLARRVDLSLSK